MSRLQEFQQLFCEIEMAWEKEEQVVLVILTNVKGSAYRLPGTKMVMTSTGNMFGTISGGCLEADLYAWAEKVFETKQPMSLRYDLSEREIWSLGIGCKGDLEFLFLPINQNDRIWQNINKTLQQNLPFTIIIEKESGQTSILDHATFQLINGSSIPDDVVNRAKKSTNTQTRAELYIKDGREYYIDVIKRSEQLIVAGAGKDAIPVVELAYKVGFHVTVFDTRKHFNNEQYFPNASHVTLELESINPSEYEQCWWIIMNHHQEKDEASLKLAIDSKPRYIGVLGPTYRTNEMLQNIGYSLSDAPIHAPIGLDLGAETSDEVAVSIISELMSFRTGRSPNYLHGKGKIHE